MPPAKQTQPAPSVPPLRTWRAERAAYAQRGPCGDRAFVMPLNAGRTAVVVIDVAAHGAARARLSSIVARAIASALRHGGSPATAIHSADARLRKSDEEYPYAVAFVGVIDPLAQTLLYSSAGHACAFAVDGAGWIRDLAPTTSMLGIPLASDVTNALFILDLDETLVVATDGIADSRRARTVDFFGATGAARVVAHSLRLGTDPALAILDAARVHAGGDQLDDVAVVIARFQND
jgi:serine phosphatase RsbU (regulator of sigma subunit)